DGHYFCGAGRNRPDGSDETLTHFSAYLTLWFPLHILVDTTLSNSSDSDQTVQAVRLLSKRHICDVL
ncbi:hypothetical protein, partial [Escherichia coli]|uniref:hypothetical protein n=1 Tax=Escherichia coli TaxID=562 RepID=UPI001BC853C5